MPFNKTTASEAGKKSSRKGVPKRSTAEVREDIQKIVDELTPLVLEDLKDMHADKRVHHYIRLLNFVLPKLQQENNMNAPDVPILDFVVDMTEWK